MALAVQTMMLAALLGTGPAPARAATPEERGLAFLAAEVPRWAAENKCYSCHNNGDAARALYQALRRSYSVPAKALEDTSRWLARPDGWDKNGGENAPKDLGLARVQFAAALVEAMDAGQVSEKQALKRAAEFVARDQQKDGSWKPDGEETVGSPATYGNALLTTQARRVLFRADAEHHREAIDRADRWLRQTRVQTVTDAAAVLLALADSDDAAARKQRGRCLDLLKAAQSKQGGWGPYAGSASEPFDTALVLLALAGQEDAKDIRPLRERGRAYLIAQQQKDGSWRETTRPAGAESYPRRLSR